MDSLIQVDDLERGMGAKLLRRLTGGRPTGILVRPFGVAWDGDDLLITDASAGRVLRVAPGGRFSASAVGHLETPVALAVCSGRVLVVDSRQGRLVRLSHDLRQIEDLLVDLERPTGVACEGDQVWVLETGRHRLVNLRPDGSVRTVGRRGGGEGEFNFPTALALGGGSLWIADTLNFRIQRLDSDTGAPLGSFGRIGADPGEMPRLKGVAVDREGRLWVSDAHLDQVALFAPGGDYLMSIGGTGEEPGRFSFPAGIAAHRDGRVAVVDSLNRRLQIFRLLDESTPDDPRAASLP